MSATLVLNTVFVDTWNNIATKILSDSLLIPSLTNDITNGLGLLFILYILFRYREFIFGGWRPVLEIDAPPEADRKWQPTKFYAPEDQKLLIPGKDMLIRTYDPTTGAHLGSGVAKIFFEKDVKQSVDLARQAQAKWIKTSYAERGQVLKLLNDYVVKNIDLICRMSSRDTGKTMVDGFFGEILTTCEKITWTLNYGEAALAPEYREVGVVTAMKTARVEYQPFGVLGAIIPWNYPFHNMFGQIISAIFSGNALVLKVSEHTAWSSEFFVSIVKKALRMLGHDENLVQIVQGCGLTGAALIPLVDKMTFIGSPEVGKLVMKKASETLTPVVLELGGKDAAIVCEDCDFDQVISHVMRGTYQNCGQNCIGMERVVVLAGVYDKFVKEISDKVLALKQGAFMDASCRTFDVGAMTMGNNEIARIEKLVNQAVSAGATLVTGGKKNPNFPNGSFMEPTLLVGVTKDMDIARNEVFGPVMTIIKAANDEEAIAIVNSTAYGLGSSVYSLDYTRAERLGKALRTGMCNLNDFGVSYLCQSLPFGGVNISGFDRFAGKEGIRGCCNLRAITSDKVTGVRTLIPPILQYPMTDAGFNFCLGLCATVYGDGLIHRIKGIFKLATANLSKPKNE